MLRATSVGIGGVISATSALIVGAFFLSQSIARSKACVYPSTELFKLFGSCWKVTVCELRNESPRLPSGPFSASSSTYAKGAKDCLTGRSSVLFLPAPTIHAGWSGNSTLEIANVGPFHFVLRENDVIAQLTVATISSSPDPKLKKKASATFRQKHVTGKASGKAASSSKHQQSGS